MDELECNIHLAFYEKFEWYQIDGFFINGLKSELIGIGCDPVPITVAGIEIKAKPKQKLLVLNISSDISWTTM